MHIEPSSNQVAIPFDGSMFGALPEGQQFDPVVLSARLEQEGCLLLRGVLPRETVLDLREAYFSRLPPRVLAPGTSAREGVSSGIVPDELPPHGHPGHPAHEFVRSEVFLGFVDRPELSSIAASLSGTPVRRIPRTPLRQFFSGSGRASRAHTDFTYLDQGSMHVITFWVPVGDCGLEGGPLVYLERSHELDLEQLRAGVDDRTDRPWDRRPITHDLVELAKRTGRRWLWGDFRAGDVAIHQPHIVHASLDCCSPTMRLSIDVRFQPAGDPLDPRWCTHWSGDDGY